LPIRIIWKAPFAPSENEPSQSAECAIVSENVKGAPESEPFPVTCTVDAARVSATALSPIASALSAASGSPPADVVPLAEGEPPGAVPEAPAGDDEVADEQAAAPAASMAMRHALAAWRVMFTDIPFRPEMSDRDDKLPVVMSLN
jgi:hypothetical protein